MGSPAQKEEIFTTFFLYSYKVKRAILVLKWSVVHEYALFCESPKLVLLFFNVKRQECRLPGLPGWRRNEQALKFVCRYSWSTECTLDYF